MTLVNVLGVEVLSWVATIAMVVGLVLLGVRMYLVVGRSLFDLTTFIMDRVNPDKCEPAPPDVRVVLACFWPLLSLLLVPMNVILGTYLLTRPVCTWVWRNLLSDVFERAPRARVVDREDRRE